MKEHQSLTSTSLSKVVRRVTILGCAAISLRVRSLSHK